MKQLSFIDEPKDQSDPIIHWHLYIDGASRNNPGPAGAGACLFKNGKTVFKKGFYLGTKTNNQAEYLALLIGVYLSKDYVDQDSHLSIFADSQLIVRQMQGQYKVREDGLKGLQKLAFKMLTPIDYTLAHIMREENAQADKMANQGIDKKVKLPKDFITYLHEHEIDI